MSMIEKQCVFCGESCVGHPRIKNEKGQYAHKECAESQHPANPEAQSEIDDADLDIIGFDDDDGFADMGDLLPGAPVETQQPAMRAACPSLSPGSAASRS